MIKSVNKFILNKENNLIQIKNQFTSINKNNNNKPVSLN
jgi:hypothetical protein